MAAKAVRARAQRPRPGELPGTDACSRYQWEYIAAAPDGDVVATLATQGRRMIALLRTVPPHRESWRYARGKWSIREVAGHLVDIERLFAFRATHFARGDRAPLPDMDPDAWAARSNAADRSLRDITEELRTVRASTVALLEGLAPEAWDRRGVSGGRKGTVRVMAWVMAGHATHHEAILRQKYGLRPGAKVR